MSHDSHDSSHPKDSTRRDFLAMTIAAGVIAGVRLPLAGESRSGIAYRVLGHTGEKVSMVGIGGYHLGLAKSEDESIRMVRTALDNGVNFLDNCWDYNDGASEIRMGKALRDGYRQKAFLMSKIDSHSRQGCTNQIDESLKRLQTDHVDLMQFHEVIRPDDPEKIFAPNGSFEAMMAAKKAGKVRYIGFTGHKDPNIHAHMLEVAFKNKFTFDTVQMPLNVMDAHFDSFEKKVLPTLVEHKIGVLGMKPLGSGIILKSKSVSAIECLHYAMNLPTSVVITGCESLDRVNQALEAARSFKPMPQEQVAALLAKTKNDAVAGRFEHYKTTHEFDGTVQNPHWLS